MAEASSKKLSAAKVVSDIRSGMGDPDLMKKYGLNEKQLGMLMKKLVERGDLSAAELSSRLPRESEQQVDASNNRQTGEEAADKVPLDEQTAQPASVRTAVSPPKRHSAVLLAVLCLTLPAIVVAIFLFGSMGTRPPDVRTAPVPAERVVIFKSRGAEEGIRHVRTATSGKKPKQGDLRTTPLIQAAGKGDVARVKELLAQGVDVNEKDGKGWTPLCVAAYNGRVPAVSLLLEKGAAIETKNQAGWTPLICAASKGRKDVVELLLTQGADANAISSVGLTALNAAAGTGHADVAKLLLARGADINLAEKGVLKPPVYRAMQHKRSSVVSLLVQSGAQFKPDDNDVTNFVVFAAKKGDLEALRLVVSKGANVNAPDTVGTTPLYAAVGENRFDTAKWLLENSAEPNAGDAKSISPLMYAVRLGNKDMVALLLMHGADPNRKGEKTGFGGDDTPLISAIESGDPGLVAMLLEKGADLKTPGTFGRTPLESACVKNAVPIMEILINKGADVNERTSNERGTVLMFAAANNRVDAVKLLLAKGADVSLKDERGFTALGYARLWNRQEIVDLLKAHGATD